MSQAEDRRSHAEHPDKATPRPGPTPSGPPRPATNTDPRGHYSAIDHLDPELRAELDERFPSAWPPDDATIDSLKLDDVIVFAVESETTGNYSSTRQELISAKVLIVEPETVRARIVGPVAHAEHHGSHAGHGFRVGDQVDVRLLDNDPEVGNVFVGRWDFVPDA